MGGCLGIATAARGATVAWVAPTYKNTRPLWRFIENATAGVSGVSVNKTDRVVAFPTGGTISIYSADNDVTMRGEAFDFVVVDEAAQIGESTYSDVLLPTLADRDGKCLLISTPKGRNWFWAEFVRAQADGQRSMAFTAPTSANPLPTIRRAAQLARERVSDRTYRQEWLAEFIEDSGVFRMVREAATAEAQAEPQAGHEYVIGVDWGRQDDATVFTVLDATSRTMAHIDRMTQTDYNLQVSRLRVLIERFRAQSVIAEYNSMGGPIIERLQADGLPIQAFTTTNASKAQAIDALVLAFERSELRILPEPLLLAELQAYAAERLPSGVVRYSAPNGLHDDYVMSLALAWHGITAAAWLLL